MRIVREGRRAYANLWNPASEDLRFAADVLRLNVLRRLRRGAQGGLAATAALRAGKVASCKKDIFRARRLHRNFENDCWTTLRDLF